MTAALLVAPQGASAGSLSYSLNIVGAFGGEPSITSDGTGILYDTTPSGHAPVYRSKDHGLTWTSINTGWTSSGDDCLSTDQAGTLYWCNLGSIQSHTPEAADVWHSTIASTCTTACSWIDGLGVLPGDCGTSCSPFGVDRDWLASSILPPNTTTDHAEVVLMYHDFFGPSSIWVNISHDGGATFGAPINALASLNPGAIPGTVEAEGYTFCSTVPAGVGIVPPGKPHAGRLIVAWIASDAPSDATGCNYTMADAFHTLWVSYSDDDGSTWTPQQAFDGGVGHDSSTPFVGFTLDDQGNPYFGFDMMHWDSNPATNEANVGICASEAQSPSLQSDTRCNYDMYVVWSSDGGATWDGGGGTIPGSAAAPYQVDPQGEIGTRFMPAITAGDPGKVDVAYLRTPTIEPSDTLGKVLPGGCAGPNSTNRVNFPPPCAWYLYQGQSLDLTSPPGAATFATSNLTAPYPMHTGDICTLGIACVGTLGANRHLLDFIQETVDPTTGCAHIGYADDNATGSTSTVPPSPASPNGNHLVSANQTDGSAIIGGGACTLAAATPESPLTTLLPAGAAAAAAVGIGVRRRRQGRAGRRAS